jgi:mono/diheme cytochrome c family protein
VTLRAFLALVVLVGACTHLMSYRVYLPEGDVAQGREAFRELRCYTCHTVRGEEFPPPGASPPTHVVLGGAPAKTLPDDDLVTAIISPSHRIDPAYEKERVTSFAGGSRMANYTEVMTIRQLTDLVAFLRDVNKRARKE